MAYVCKTFKKIDPVFFPFVMADKLIFELIKKNMEEFIFLCVKQFDQILVSVMHFTKMIDLFFSGNIFNQVRNCEITFLKEAAYSTYITQSVYLQKLEGFFFTEDNAMIY